MQKHVNFDLRSLYKWLLANKISLNCSKTELIIFGNPNFNFKIKMNGHKINPSPFIKYLGIYLDNNLNGNYHCSILLKKLKRANGMLCKSRHYVPSHELKSIYHAIFSSHMIYGCQVWGQKVDIHTQKVFKLQNRAMRIITFSGFRDNASPLYKELKILKLDDYILLQNCLLAHDFINNKLPECFNSYFKSVSEIHSQGTRSNQWGCLHIPHFATTKFGLDSITNKCIHSWNHFSKLFKCNLKNLTRNSLKNKIYSHLIDSY
jgi:hypothetical protein